MDTITVEKLDIVGLDYHEDDYDGAPAVQFNVNATTTQYRNNRDNYLRETGSETEVLTANSLDELYERMAAYKVRNEMPGKGQWDDHDSVGFDGISITIATTYFDENKLTSSETWIKHLAAVEAAAQEAARKSAEAAAARQVKQDEAERALLATLLAKHRPQSG
jgi:hypothetical protein